jgi:hypothetical protein
MSEAAKSQSQEPLNDLHREGKNRRPRQLYSQALVALNQGGISAATS